MLEDEMGVWMLALHRTRLLLESQPATQPGTSDTGTTTSARSSNAGPAGLRMSLKRRFPESRLGPTGGEVVDSKGVSSPPKANPERDILLDAPVDREPVLDPSLGPCGGSRLSVGNPDMADRVLRPRRMATRKFHDPVGLVAEPRVDRPKRRKGQAEDLPDSPCHPNRVEEWEE